MPLFTTLAALSQTPGSNPPDGTVDAPSTIDDQLRLLASFVAQLRDGTGFTQPSPLINNAVGSDGTLGWRNRLHNGNFAINQRNVSGTVTLAAGAYGHDRWKAGAGGCTYTFATSGIDTVVTISAGSLMQVLEAANVEGGQFALANRGTAQARIAVNGAATSGSYATATQSSPLLSASATANQQMTVEFTTGTLDRVQLEPGINATAFQRRPLGEELRMCRRFFRKSFDTIASSSSIAGAHQAIAQTSSVLTAASVDFIEPMRTAPTITHISPVDAANGNVGEYNLSGAAVTNRTPTLVGAVATGFLTTVAAATVGNQIFFHWTASADL